MHGSCIESTASISYWGLPHLACSMVEDAQKIVKFIRLHLIILAIFRKHATIFAQGLSFLSLSTIRFATNFFMVARVEWDTYVRTLSDTQKKPVPTQAQEVERLILSDDFEFWQSFASYCTVMKAVVATLKEFNGKQPCMGNVYIFMRALHHHVAALRNAPFNMPSHLLNPLEVVL
jgi:hypothetical protein